MAIQADFVMADGHKWMLGPEGIALFYSRPAARESLTLRQYGWHMVETTDFDHREWEIARSARRFECGSPNMLGIHALSASLSLLEQIGMQEIERGVLENIDYLFELLQGIKGIKFLTPQEREHHAGIINFTIAQVDMLDVYHKLLKNNIICVYRGGGLRLSPHFYTSRDKISKTVEVINTII